MFKRAAITAAPSEWRFTYSQIGPKLMVLVWKGNKRFFLADTSQRDRAAQFKWLDTQMNAAEHGARKDGATDADIQWTTKV